MNEQDPKSPVGTLAANELESPKHMLIELRVLWKNSAIRVLHLSPGQSFFIRRHGHEQPDCVVVDAPELPKDSNDWSVVQYGAAGPVMLIPPRTAYETKLTSTDNSEGLVREIAGDTAVSIPIAQGSSTRCSFGSLDLECTLLPAPKALHGRKLRDRAMTTVTLASAFVVLSGLAVTWHTAGERDERLASPSHEANLEALISASTSRTPAEEHSDFAAREANANARNPRYQHHNYVVGGAYQSLCCDRGPVGENGLPLGAVSPFELGGLSLASLGDGASFCCNEPQRARHLRPIVRDDPPIASETPADPRVTRVFHQHRDELRDCLAQTLTQRPDAAGRIQLRIDTNRTGEVLSAHVHANGTGETLLGNCIENRVERWRFAPSAEGRSFDFALTVEGQ